MDLKLDYKNVSNVSRRIPELGMYQAAFSFNSVCQADCLGCCGYILNNPPEEMPLYKVKQALHTLISEFKIEQVYISCSAEMTLRKDVVEIVRYVNSLEDCNSKLRVEEDTNARYIPEGFIEAVNINPYRYNIGISLWGGDEEDFIKYQGPGDFNKTVDNINKYISQLGVPPYITAPCITEEQFEKIAILMNKIANKHNLDFEVVYDGTLPNLCSLRESGTIPLLRRAYRSDEGVHYDEKIDVDKYTTNRCPYLFGGFIMDVWGNITPCHEILTFKNKTGADNHLNLSDDSIIGNIYDYEPFDLNAFNSILHSEKARGVFERNFIPGQLPLERCKNCGTRISHWSPKLLKKVLDKKQSN